MDKQILSHTWAAHIVGTQGKNMPYIIGYLYVSGVWVWFWM